MKTEKMFLYKDNKVRSIKVWLARYRDELLLHYPKSYSIRKAILKEYEKIIMEVDENYG